jgi:hypothetical protein
MTSRTVKMEGSLLILKRINEFNLKNNQSRVLMSARSAQSCSTLSRGSKKGKRGSGDCGEGRERSGGDDGGLLEGQ